MSEAIAGQPGIPSTLDRAYAFLSGDDAYQTPAAYALVCVIIGIAEAGVRLGRKTYLVDGAPPTRRVSMPPSATPRPAR